MLRNIFRILNSRLFYTNSFLSCQQIVSREQTQKIIEEIPSLTGIPHENWEKTCTIFKNYDFNFSDILQLIKYNRTLLTRPTIDIIDTIEFWRSFQFGEKRFQELILQHPEYLDVNNKQIVTNRISYLKHYVRTSKNVWYLLINSPNILYNKENEIENYFQYLEERMRLSIPEIVKSNVFSKSLNTLKCRHIFLERLGIFKPKSIKSDLNEPTLNPRLNKVIDTTDKEFCKKLCGVSLLEFETFLQLFDKEQLTVQNEENIESDSEEN